MQSTFENNKLVGTTRKWLSFFMIMLIISGITAMPAERELSIATRFFNGDSAIADWLNQVYEGVTNTNKNYPFLFYGNDWLAFAHLILAILFVGPYKDPVKNKWVIEFGMIACILIIPMALFAGYFRGIPLWWRMIDCSFGILGMIPLVICYRIFIRVTSYTIITNMPST